MRLSKHHGLGNDFLIVLEEVNGPVTVTAERTRELCDRRRGIGADGLIVGAVPAKDSSDGDGHPVDVVMTLRNADGGVAEMSGNGIRCLGQALAQARDEHQTDYVVATDAGLRRLTVHDDAQRRLATVSVTMGAVAGGPAVPPDVAERLGARRHATVDVGNPHLVVVVDDVGAVDLGHEGAWLEARFADGINVEFIAVAEAPDTLGLRVWERGAGVTEACGTGAVAAAHLAHAWGLVGTEVRVEMPGGVAEVVLAGEEPLLVGPTQHVATIEVPDA
ncbi:MAG: diaminopimelate epimerase [Acidimicrobiales bacterium]|jgi:diaminopimelate epimerase|nr:diaminopimelate epimerase [Acidimicrobiales bacterium]